jgi:hypothetical protein
MKNDVGEGDERVCPGDLECFVELKKVLPKEFVEEFKNRKEEGGWVIFGGLIDVELRNTWGLWSESSLAKYFRQLGVSNADDMSLIIATSFHRHLNGEEIRLQRQINRLKFSLYCNQCKLRYGLIHETVIVKGQPRQR